MSISLVVLRLEIAEKYPLLHHFQFQAFPKNTDANIGDHEASPSEWPVLVTERLLAIHRGQREPGSITIITLENQAILEEMSALNGEDSLKHESKDDYSLKPINIPTRDAKDVSASGSVPRIPSKESTPGPSSSKEGTPSLADEGSRRFTFKECINFISGNPMVDVTKGIIHLFKENTKTSLDEDSIRSEMLCMIAVPSSMTIHDLLQFTAPFNGDIQHMRIIRDANPNQYMVIIKFRGQEDADLFYSTYNGQVFNSFESDLCRLVYVARLETTSESKEGGLPIPGHSELPTCPVCLERMDESVDGILTILCNHSFHGECLSKWGDTTCPVCRFCQTPEESPDQRCLSCGAADSLWICLICGNIGCGRYVGGHAHRHFLETNHLFSLQLGNNRVWDYVRDNYVHRLLQSEGDGKVVSYERDTPIPSTKEELGRGDEKLSDLQLEYTELLSSQLDSQREYFETKVFETQAEALREVEEIRQIAASKGKELKGFREQCTLSKKENTNLEKKVNQISQKINRLNRDLETEKELNISLREGRKDWVEKVINLERTVDEKNKEISELSSQLRDMMLHFEAQEVIRANPELESGQVGVSEEAKNSKRKSSRRGK